MNKFLISLFFTFFPILAFAEDSSLSFKPPASDYSVVFLGNIFGVVDGVLHGSGSQIMGTMFGVFNAAVLALGGIIIIYTLMVSTLNTAQEGQFLGQKFSSIWVPVRTTFGLALLIPKASGYCLMQIFVMWVVVQGVGAADKVWNAALDYLNRGGAIVQAQPNPGTQLIRGSGLERATGAQTILAGQVCMLGLQKQLENQRDIYNKQKQDKTGPCYGTLSPEMKTFCQSSIPNFINTVNLVTIQNDSPKQPDYTVPMPNFESSSVYSKLNGICGNIFWNAFTMDEKSVRQIKTIKQSDIDTAKLSRVIALQQMYMDLSMIAQVMINNNPELTKGDPDADNNYSPIAQQQFGVPQTPGGRTCPNSKTENCIIWGQATGSKTAPIFNGTEFLGALTDYDAIMLPTLTLIQQSVNIATANSGRKFFDDAYNQGWIMAGSYFFNLVNLNMAATSVNSGDAGNLKDQNTGLEKSTFDSEAITAAFSGNNSCVSTSKYQILCKWLNGNVSKVQDVLSLIGGGGKIPTVAAANLSPGRTRPTIDNLASSTVYGFTNNSTILKLPDQPGQKPLQFANLVNMTIETDSFRLPKGHFECGPVKIILFKFCLGKYLGQFLYNDIVVPVYNFFLSTFQQLIDYVIFSFLMVPIQGMAAIFKLGLEIISTPGVNPVVALAKMGTYYINFSANLWLFLMQMSIFAAMLPLFNFFLFPLIALGMPLLIAWLSVMVSVGMITAYYVPILPYMIFTFGAIAWLIAVIEAMVAAPIVALGVTHPEGHEAFGKGETAIMLLMNVFLRPAMMIIGYISAIALCYVGVWILNAGFDNAINFIQGDTEGANAALEAAGNQLITTDAGQITGGYTNWAGIYSYFFSILIYTTTYLIIVQKSFTLISYLPDKVLRWIGGTPESLGQESAGWAEGEAKKQIETGGERTQAAQAAIDKQIQGTGMTMASGIQQAVSGSGNVTGGEDKDSGSDKKDGGDDGDGGGSGGSGGGPPSGGSIPPEAAAL